MSSSFPLRLARPGRFLSLLPLTLALSACGISEYTRPAGPDLAAGFAAASPGMQESGPWWQSFQDPALDGLIRQGLARNLSIQEAIAAIDAAEAGVGLARAADLPGVALSGGATRGDAGTGAGIGERSSATLSTSWLLDIFGGNRASREAAVADWEAAKLSQDVARRAVTAAIASAYIDLRFYQESMALTRQSIASRQETLKLTRDMVEVGQASRLDQLQAEQAVAQAQASLPGLEIGFDRAVNRLATLTNGRSADLRPGLEKRATQPSARFKPSVGLPAEVIRARPDVALSERQLAAAAARIGVAEAAFWPSVSLSGSITPTNISGGGNVTSWSIGPQINLPIFSGGANKARLSAAEANAVQAELKWRGAVLSAVEEVENGLSSWNRGSSNVAAQRRLVGNAQETVSLAREAWGSGQTDFFTVLDAERNLLSARSALAGAVRDLASGYVAISIAAGAPL